MVFIELTVEHHFDELIGVRLRLVTVVTIDDGQPVGTERDAGLRQALRETLRVAPVSDLFEHVGQLLVPARDGLGVSSVIRRSMIAAIPHKGLSPLLDSGR